MVFPQSDSIALCLKFQNANKYSTSNLKTEKNSKNLLDLSDSFEEIHVCENLLRGQLWYSICVIIHKNEGKIRVEGMHTVREEILQLHWDTLHKQMLSQTVIPSIWPS